ncbi:unnamed protein product [Eruca vesicaria subsp. sativa]|uniref:Uncharacterized protein n=1 Tax=Eruca vesicaria subsp. sativa TaxID=29727 RepID=A0ABC8J4X9_ERUVS|nr:unnamed protein product [Eruca vesicaria subsp. sativa]
MDQIKSNQKAEEAETANIDPSDLVKLVVPEKSYDEETEKKVAMLSLSEAAKEMVPSHFAAFLEKQKGVPDLDLWRFIFYLEEVFSSVSSLQWFNMLKKSPLSLDPLSHIPKSVYEAPMDWINKLPTDHCKFVTWALDRLLTDLAAHARGEEQPFAKSQVATLVELAMVLRAKPDSLNLLLSMLRGRPMYQGEDKLPLIVWMMSQASQVDLPLGLYSWACNLLPLVDNNNVSSHSIDLILQFVEMILSSPEGHAVLVNGAVRDGERLIPPCSFEILVRLTFPAKVEEATKRFEAVYPLLKEVALAADSTSADSMKQIFTFSLKLAGQKGIIGNKRKPCFPLSLSLEYSNLVVVSGNPALASEATAIAIRVMTENVDCFMQWDVLYKENLEASVALLKKLVDEWKDHSLQLSSSSSNTLTVNRTMNSFRRKNEKAITEGVANLSLYKEADQSCKLISKRLSFTSFSRIDTCNTISELQAAVDNEEKDVEEKSYGVVGAAEETENVAAMLSLSEAVKEIDPSHFAAFLEKVMDEDWYQPEKQMLKLMDYYGIKLSHVSSFQWAKMYQDYPLSKLIDVPISLIPMSLYEKSIDFIDKLPYQTPPAVVLWGSELILTDWPELVKVSQLTSNISTVAIFIALAMVLRTKPDVLTDVLPKLRKRPAYQGEDKLPVLIWMMAQASQGDLSAGLYSWVRNLLPLVVNNNVSSHSIDLILQFVEMILSSPEARAVLVNGAVRDGERLIPPCSFEILVRLTFPAIVEEATKRFEAIYPLLKEVALAPDSSANAVKQIFTFSLKLAGQKGNPALASEATAIAIRVLTENVDCFMQWDVLYKENLEASVALLKKLVDEWKDHSLKLSLSSSDTLTVNRTMNSFRRKNEIAITEGEANLSLYKEADQSCKLISKRLLCTWVART